jgi:hypothetical protein
LDICLIAPFVFAIISPIGEYMANHARVLLESALRERKLDCTLTTALDSFTQADAAGLAPLDLAIVDDCLHGGLPRGHLSELAGPHSSGRTSLLLRLMAAATRRGELVALVDPCDRLDVASAATAGVDLDRLLWIRGHGTVPAQGAASEGSMLDRAVERALKALNLVLQAGGFGVVALDLADVPLPALGRIPFTTWPRVQRVLEGRDTACVLLTPRPLARSAGGVTLSLAGQATWAGTSARSQRLSGTRVHVRIVSPRRRVSGDVSVTGIA